MWRRSVEEFVEAIQSEEEIIIYDLRVKDTFERDPFPGAVNLTIPEIEQMLEEGDYTIFQKDKPIYMICYTGNMSDQFAETLYEEGFDQVYSIVGGYVRYLRSKLIHVMDDENALESKALATEVEAAKLREEGAARKAKAEHNIT